MILKNIMNKHFIICSKIYLFAWNYNYWFKSVKKRLIIFSKRSKKCLITDFYSVNHFVKFLSFMNLISWMNFLVESKKRLDLKEY